MKIDFTSHLSQMLSRNDIIFEMNFEVESWIKEGRLIQIKYFGIKTLKYHFLQIIKLKISIFFYIDLIFKFKINFAKAEFLSYKDSQQIEFHESYSSLEFHNLKKRYRSFIYLDHDSTVIIYHQNELFQ
jgi:hypothetical protein